MPYEISSLQKNAAPDEAVQSRGYILIEHMCLDKFGKLVRDIRITRSLLLYDMAKTLDISPAELSAIECGKKPGPCRVISSAGKQRRFLAGSFLRLKSTMASATPALTHSASWLRIEVIDICPGEIERTRKAIPTQRLTPP